MDPKKAKKLANGFIRERKVGNATAAVGSGNHPSPILSEQSSALKHNRNRVISENRYNELPQSSDEQQTSDENNDKEEASDDENDERNADENDSGWVEVSRNNVNKKKKNSSTTMTKKVGNRRQPTQRLSQNAMPIWATAGSFNQQSALQQKHPLIQSIDDDWLDKVIKPGLNHGPLIKQLKSRNEELLLELNFYQTKLIAKDRELNNCREKLAQQNAELQILRNEIHSLLEASGGLGDAMTRCEVSNRIMPNCGSNSQLPIGQGRPNQSPALVHSNKHIINVTRPETTTEVDNLEMDLIKGLRLYFDKKLSIERMFNVINEYCHESSSTVITVFYLLTKIAVEKINKNVERKYIGQLLARFFVDERMAGSMFIGIGQYAHEVVVKEKSQQIPFIWHNLADTILHTMMISSDVSIGAPSPRLVHFANVFRAADDDGRQRSLLTLVIQLLFYAKGRANRTTALWIRDMYFEMRQIWPIMMDESYARALNSVMLAGGADFNDTLYSLLYGSSVGDGTESINGSSTFIPRIQ